jgi:hypothetical protein
MTINSQFFARDDKPVPGPARELVGHGERPPQVRWRDDATVAVNIVVNYEEGAEKSFPMGDDRNDIYTEIPFGLQDQRDLAFESDYEYGSRAGIWRLFRVFAVWPSATTRQPATATGGRTPMRWSAKRSGKRSS